MRVVNVFLIPCVLSILMGCVTVEKKISDISCRYTFSDIERAEDQSRIDLAIRSVAKGEVFKTGTDTDPEYDFTVESLTALDKIHPRILYKNPAAQRASDLYQTLNARDPVFEISYNSTDISASIEVSVKFGVKPGSQLFYKNHGGSEIDITPQVDYYGKVNLQTKIKKGQEFIFARTVLDDVSRYIKIDIYDQDVTDINRAEYDSMGLSGKKILEGLINNLNKLGN